MESNQVSRRSVLTTAAAASTFTFIKPELVRGAGKHIFAEKPIATDPAGVHRFVKALRKAEQKKLTVMSGAQRHCSREYVETVRKIHDGQIGEIQALYSEYLSRPVMHAKARDP